MVQEKATVVGQEEEERASSLATGAQGGKRPAGSPLPDLAEKKQRAIQDSGSSSSEGLDRLWPAGSPNEVSFLHFQLKTSTPKASQERCSGGPEAGDTGQPPNPRLVGIKEEQVSHEIE